MWSARWPYTHGWHSISDLTSLMPTIALLTLAIVYGGLTVSSAWTRNLASRKPNWLNEPTPPATFWPYLARIPRYSWNSGPLWSSGEADSALTNSFLFHFGPSAWARKSVLHGVEQPHDLTRSSIPSFCAAWRITSASGGVKLRITEPLWPAPPGRPRCSPCPGRLTARTRSSWPSAN